MADVTLPSTLHWVFSIVITIVAWECAKRLVQAFTSKPAPRAVLDRATPEEYQELLQVPSEPHIELSLDPHKGLHFSNPRDTYAFENDYCYGSYLYFHPPAGETNTTGPEGFDYRDYFKGKSRLWEIRIQMHFKQPPAPDMDMFFGIELEEYVPLSMATKQAQKLIVTAINHAVGGLYQSPGDDPARSTGERERPCCVLPLWAFDQFIETPEGQEPPRLSDPAFPDLGKKRYKRISEYAKEMEAFQKSFKVGPAYTFAFWGNSRFLDVMNWTVIGIPVATPLDFNRFAGKPPVYVALYSLKPNPNRKSGEHRHVQSRKNYYWRAAVWSSSFRPERSCFERLAGVNSNGTNNAGPLLKKKGGLRRRIGGLFKMFDACTMRTKD